MLGLFRADEILRQWYPPASHLSPTVPDVSEPDEVLCFSAEEVDQQNVETVSILGSAYYREIYNAQAAKLKLSYFLRPNDETLDRYTLGSLSAGQDPVDGQGLAVTKETGIVEPPKSSIKDKVKGVLRKSSTRFGAMTKNIRKSRTAKPSGLPATAGQNVLTARSLEENILLGGWSTFELPEAYAPVGLIVPSCIAASATLLLDLSGWLSSITNVVC